MLITLDTDPAFHERVAAHAAEAGLPGDGVRAFGVDEVEHALAGGARPDVLIGGPGLPMQELLNLTARLREEVPHCIVLAVALPTTATLRAALRAGIRDVLVPSFTAQDLSDALAATGFGQTREPLSLPGRTIAVFSSKGGVGTSVLASNLALRLAELTGAPTVLADCDLASADQAVLHGLRPRYTIQEVADGAVDQDLEALEQLLLPVPDTELRVLAGPLDPASAETITDGAVLEALRRLRQLVGLVVVDTASAFTDATLTVLEAADAVVLPVSLDVLSLRSLVVTLQTFDRLGIARDHVHVVVVRSDAKVGLTVADVVRTAGTEVSVAIPSSREVARSVNTATPLALYAPRSTVIRAIDELVDLVTDGVTIHGADDRGEARGRRRLRLRRGDGAVTEMNGAAVADGSASAAVVDEEAGTPAPPDDPDVVTPPPPEEAAPAVTDPVVGAEPQPRRVRVRRAGPPSAATAPTVVRRREPPAAKAEPTVVVVDDDDDDDDDGADVISLAPPHDRLASMPPPVFDATPSSADDGRTGRRRRRKARS